MTLRYRIADNVVVSRANTIYPWLLNTEIESDGIYFIEAACIVSTTISRFAVGLAVQNATTA